MKHGRELNQQSPEEDAGEAEVRDSAEPGERSVECRGGATVKWRGLRRKEAVELFGKKVVQCGVVEQRDAKDDGEEVEEAVIAGEDDENLKGDEYCASKETRAARSED